MADVKLRIKFGEHEFEGEAPIEILREQMKIFLALVAPGGVDPGVKLADTEKASAEPPFKRILRVSRRYVYSTVPGRPEDLVLLVLHGQKAFRQNEMVTGGEIMRGLQMSGVRVPRVDLILRRHIQDGLVATRGSHRMRRYSLKSAGVARAEQAAQHLVKLLEK